MRYTPIGDEVTIEAAIVQATIATDVAGKFAQQEKNPDAMLQVADFWMKLADFMAAYEQAKEKKPEAKQTDVPMGFQSSPTEIEENNARDFADFED